MTAPSQSPPLHAPAPSHSAAAPRRVGVGARLGRGSAVYAVCGGLNLAIGFLLLPIYTHLLTADQYGAVTVVLVVASFLGVLFAMALSAAVMRFYHEYRDRPDELGAFLGTLLTAV